MRLTIANGPHPLVETVLSLPLPEDAEPRGALLDPAHPRRPLPWQVHEGRLYFQAPPLAPGKKRTLHFLPDRTYPARYGEARVEDTGGKLLLTLAGKRFTEYIYRYRPPQTRPVFYPLLGPREIPVTRAWPLEERPGESQDHPHHRSLFFAHGDLNGVDFWSEAAGAGTQEHEEFEATWSGRLLAGMRQRLTWRSSTGQPVVEELRQVQFYNLRGNLRLMDVAVTFRARYGEVRFGDTKEGGIIALRMAETMKEARGGRIENAFGGVGEEECWGKPAPWVDYSGIVSGKRLGVAVFDHRDNLRHPTRWHVRAYGLFALNPFGLSHYRYGREENGDFLLASGEDLAFRFRLLIHRGDARRGKVREHYLAWAFPPRLTLED